MPRSKTVVDIVKLGRFHFIAGGLLLFMCGALAAVLSGSDFSLTRLLFGYLVFFPAHLAVHYANDYFDSEADRFGKPSAFAGGSGILLSNPRLRPVAKWLALGLIALSLSLGIPFVLHYSYSPWVYGYIVLGNLVGWFYTAPPLKFAYRRLGELSTVFTVGLLLPGMGYLVMKGAFDRAFLTFVVPFLFYGVAFTLSVQVPDVEGDLLGGKLTLVARRGRKLAFAGIGLAMFLASASFFALPALITVQYPFSVLGLFSLLPLSVALFSVKRLPTEQRIATMLVDVLLSCFIAFILMTDIYFAYLALA